MMRRANLSTPKRCEVAKKALRIFVPGEAKSQKADAASTWTVVKFGEQLSNVTITLAEGAASVRGRLGWQIRPPVGLFT